MEKELVNKIFYLDDYCNKNNMEEHIKEFIRKLRMQYPNAIVTREFYKGSSVLVRVTLMTINEKKEKDNDLELEKEEIRIKERGINGIGENVEREISHSHGGNGRERGGR